MSIKQRLVKLESMLIKRGGFHYIDIDGSPTPEQWAEMESAHADGCVVFAWKADGNVNIWLPNEPVMEWS